MSYGSRRYHVLRSTLSTTTRKNLESPAQFHRNVNRDRNSLDRQDLGAFCVTSGLMLIFLYFCGRIFYDTNLFDHRNAGKYI